MMSSAAVETVEEAMPARVAAHDWAATPLGPAASWPSSLRQAVDLTLSQAFPSYLCWGPDLIVAAYNDALKPMVRGRTVALGRPLRDVWPEVWAQLEPRAAQAMSGEPVLRHQARIRAKGAWHRSPIAFDYSLSPVRDDAGAIAGIFAIVIDTSLHERVQDRLAASEERLRLAFEIADVGAWDIDLLTGDVHESPEIGAMYGLPSGETNRHVRETRERTYPDDRATVERTVKAAIATGETYAVEHRIIRPDGSVRWIASRGRALYDGGGRPVRAVGVTRDITQERTERTAREASEARFRTLTDFAPALIFAVDRNGDNSFVNARYIEYTGKSFETLCGRGWLDAVHPDDRQAIEAENSATRDNPLVLEQRMRIRRHDGQWRWFLCHTEPVAGAPEDSPFRSLGISLDIDDLVRAEQRERLLAREVDHRAKNLLAVVQSVVQLTRADDIASFKKAVIGRIQSLARTHSLLSASRWEGAELSQLLRDELAPHNRGDAFQIGIHGPELLLQPNAAQSMALVFHELATNAAKYGSLSMPGGSVRVAWRIEDAQAGPCLTLQWQELGGPPTERPDRKGFGSNVIRTSIERQLAGRLTTDWRPEGLAVSLVLPLERLVSAGNADHSPVRPPEPTPAPAEPRKGSILLVEDEPLIAMQMEETLKRLGHRVVGPVASVADALALIAALDFDAALLDLNLQGERSDSVADALIARRKPFVFCSGYADATGLPQRLARVPRLAKPFEAGEIGPTVSRLLAGLD